MKNKFFQYLINYVLYASPLFILLLVWSAIINNDQSLLTSPISIFFYNALGLHGAFWIFSVLVLSTSLVLSKPLRQTLLVKLSLIKERDERETLIVGNSSKSVFLSSTAILIFLLLTTLIDVTISKKSPSLLQEGEKAGKVSVGVKLNVIDHGAIVSRKEGYNFYYEFVDIPFTKSGLILLLLVWNFTSYQYYSRMSDSAST